MKNIKWIISFLGAVGLSACQPAINKDWDELHNNFQTPPESSRPGVYWYFMDGNISKEGMTKDLEAMKQAGIAYATDQIIDLLANGVKHIHVYSMNKPDVAAGIQRNLSEILKA